MMGIGATSVGTDLEYIENLYHAGQKKGIMSRYSNEMTKPFTQPREKISLTYTEDGKKFINGELETIREGPELWATTIHSMALSKPLGKILEKESRLSRKEKKSFKKMMQRLFNDPDNKKREETKVIHIDPIEEAFLEEIEEVSYKTTVNCNNNYENFTKEPIRRLSRKEEQETRPYQCKVKRRETIL